MWYGCLLGFDSNCLLRKQIGSGLSWHIKMTIQVLGMKGVKFGRIYY